MGISLLNPKIQAIATVLEMPRIHYRNPIAIREFMPAHPTRLQFIEKA